MSSSAKIFGTSKHEKALNKFYDSGAAKQCPPDSSAHISAHNVVKISESETRAAVIEALRKKRLIELENAYGKACERKAKGRPIPSRNSYSSPYMSYGMMAGVYYAGDPT
jgi:hypothetical protein